MKSIKPGRGPSGMNMIGSIAAAVFGVFWCITAASMGALMMVPFGIIFIGIAIGNAVYSGHNTFSEDRYSDFDIVDDGEEEDPLNARYGRQNREYESVREDYSSMKRNSNAVSYCPYCGESVDKKFRYCPKCGEKLPD